MSATATAATSADESTGTGLFSLVYSSTGAEPFDDTSLRALLVQSREANGRNDISGMLLYRLGRFVQFLEGPEREVRDLLAAIQADHRHTDVRVLLQEPISTRQFSEWTMGYESMQEPQEAVPDGFRSTFDDLEASDDARLIVRAARELTLWFRVRSRTQG